MNSVMSIDFNSETFQRDPYPIYEQIRKSHPFYWDSQQRSYFALSYDAVKKSLINKMFSADCPFRASRTLFGRTIMDVDGDEHTRLRLSANTLFMPDVIPKYSENIIPPIIHKVIDQFINKGEADFVKDFAIQIPLRVVSQIIGFPEEDFAFFYEKSGYLIDYLDSTSGEGTLEKAKKALQDLSERLIPLIEENRRNPQDNVIGHLINAHENNSKYSLSDQEIMNMLTLLIPAAADTSSRLIANCLLCLCEHPDQLEAVSNDFQLIEGAINETLRFEPPIHSTIRIASQKTEIEGVEIPAGSIIQIIFASANRDEKYFEDPNVFNIYRDEAPHFSFGAGRHQCMGQGLARAEMFEVFSILFSRIKNLRFTEGTENYISGKSFRSPSQLMITFDAIGG